MISSTCFPEKQPNSQFILLYIFGCFCFSQYDSTNCQFNPIVFQQSRLPVVKDRRFYPNKKSWHPSKKLYDQRNIKTWINHFINLLCMVCRLPLSKAFVCCMSSIWQPMFFVFYSIKDPSFNVTSQWHISLALLSTS